MNLIMRLLRPDDSDILAQVETNRQLSQETVRAANRLEDTIKRMVEEKRSIGRLTNNAQRGH